jgi:hypothetical protein
VELLKLFGVEEEATDFFENERRNFRAGRGFFGPNKAVEASEETSSGKDSTEI